MTSEDFLLLNLTTAFNFALPFLLPKKYHINIPRTPTAANDPTIVPATFPDALGGSLGRVDVEVPFLFETVPVALVLEVDIEELVLDTYSRVMVCRLDIVNVPVVVDVTMSASIGSVFITPTKAETSTLELCVPVAVCGIAEVVLVTSPASYNVLVIVMVGDPFEP